MFKSLLSAWLQWPRFKSLCLKCLDYLGISKAINQQLWEERKLWEKKLLSQEIHNQELSQQIDRLEKEIQVIQAQNRHWEEMRSYFLSITSHELRTPLTIIKGAINLIQEEGPRLGVERQMKYLNMVAKNTQHMIKLLNDLLDLSRLELGHLRLELCPIDMVRLVRECLEEFREIAQEHRQVLEGNLPLTPCGLIGDPARIKQVISNLISNALKFSPPDGKIRMTLRSQNEQVELSVQDSGIGIEKAKLPFIFQQFYQADGSVTRNAEGVGLGLAIVKELVILHEGQVWLESEENKGTTFFVQLPVAGPKIHNHITMKPVSPEWEPPIVMGK